MRAWPMGQRLDTGWHAGEMEPDDEGEYVRYQDYDAVVSLLAELCGGMSLIGNEVEHVLFGGDIKIADPRLPMDALAEKLEALKADFS